MRCKGVARVLAPRGCRSIQASVAAKAIIDAKLSICGASIKPVALEEGAELLPFYSQYPLDRKAEWRSDEARLRQLFSRSDAVLLPLSR